MNCPISKTKTIEELKSLIEKNGKPYDMAVIEKAIDIAVNAHEGQKRSSGEDYVCHPLSVAAILVELGMDNETIVAAILHDVVEDTQISLDEIAKDFGKDVALWLTGLRNWANSRSPPKRSGRQRMSGKCCSRWLRIYGVIIIKLADRLHNMRTIESLPEQKRRDKAKETMDIFALWPTPAWDTGASRRSLRIYR